MSANSTTSAGWGSGIRTHDLWLPTPACFLCTIPHWWTDWDSNQGLPDCLVMVDRIGVEPTFFAMPWRCVPITPPAHSYRRFTYDTFSRYEIIFPTGCKNIKQIKVSRLIYSMSISAVGP